MYVCTCWQYHGAEVVNIQSYYHFDLNPIRLWDLSTIILCCLLKYPTIIVPSTCHSPLSFKLNGKDSVPKCTHLHDLFSSPIFISYFSPELYLASCECLASSHFSCRSPVKGLSLLNSGQHNQSILPWQCWQSCGAGNVSYIAGHQENSSSYDIGYTVGSDTIFNATNISILKDMQGIKQHEECYFIL